MIPTSTNGHMPFLSSHSNQSSVSKKSLPIPDTNKMANSSRHYSGPHSPNHRNPLFLNGIDSNNETPVLSKYGRDEILKKDHSWKAFLKALFRSKQKKQSPSIASLETTLTITLSPPSTSMVKKTSVTRPQSLRRPRTRQCALQRCNSLNATSRHIADLDAIIEEESAHAEFSEDEGPVKAVLSAPNTISRVRPTSEYTSRQFILDSENFDEKLQVLADEHLNIWPDVDRSNESVHDTVEPEISTWRTLT